MVSAIQSDSWWYRLRRAGDGTLQGTSEYQSGNGQCKGSGYACFRDMESLTDEVWVRRVKGANVIVEIDGNRV